MPATRLPAGLVLLLPNCAGVQSALHAAGPTAERLRDIGWIMIAGATAIFILVAAFTALAVYAPDRRRAWLRHRATIFFGGLALPVTLLSALLIYGFLPTNPLGGTTASASYRIRVTGERWWWRVDYLGADGQTIASANEIRLPAGAPVEFVLVSADVIHSFWIPSLGGKLDMIPGRENRLVLEAARPGIYRGQCAEYCGGQHALMALGVVAHERADFERWLLQQSQPAASPGDPFLARGQRVFLATGCGACHTIRGSAARGKIGPDLTHIGGRLTLAAGTFANNEGTLTAWIAHSQELKPGTAMPSFQMLAAADLRAVAAYLTSLK
jgi:cytochrome c oxidase subunit 2